MSGVWADATGLPTSHAIRAALRVAELIDPNGSPVVDARETYWHVASGGLLPPSDLAIGEALLVDLQLATVDEGIIRRTTLLDSLVESHEDSASGSILVASIEAHPEPASLEPELVRARVAECVRNTQQQLDVIDAVVGKFDAARRAVVGDIGEEIVFRAAQAELHDIGRSDLAREVRRVSLVSDIYGYDIVAPRVHGADRLLEVKSTTSLDDGHATVFISRHEADVGAERDDWMLVLCHIHDLAQRRGSVVGWLSYQEIKALLPTDVPPGRWEAASLIMTSADIASGLPSAFT